LMVGALEKNPEITLVYADVIKTRTENETFRDCTPTGMYRWHDWNRTTLLEKGCFIGPQPVWRKAVHQEYGYFDEKYEVSADFEFWLRISQTHEFYHIPKPLGLYLDRPDSIEHANQQKKQKEDREIFRHYRRAAEEIKVMGIMTEDEKHLNPKVRTDVQNDPKRWTASTNDNKSTNEALTQGGNNMHSPETIFKAIEMLVDNGHTASALWAMEKLLADFPDNARFHNELAVLAYEQADTDKALAHFKKAAALDPGNPVFLKNLADYCYVVEKDIENALTHYEDVLKVDPHQIESLIMAGHLSVSLHRYPQGRQYYQQALTLDPQNAEVRQILEKMNDPGLEQSTESLSVDDLYAAAGDKIKAGDCETAIALLEQALAKDDNYALAHNDLGVLQYESGNMQAALNHYEKAAALQPENDTFQKNLADFYLAVTGDHAKALKTYVQVLKLIPRDVDALLSVGQICLSLGRTDDAREFYATAMEIEPWNENGQQMMRQLEQLNDLSQPDETDLYNMAKAKASQGDLPGAIHDLTRYVGIAPEDANAHNDLGVLYFETGEKEKAVSAYEQAVRLAPTDHTYRKNLADIYLMEQGRIQEAMKLYLGVLEENPQDLESLIGCGMISAHVGQTEDARVFYNRVIEIEPWNESARKALEEISTALDVHSKGIGATAAG
jgi:tetratricopeptide (TPR) repeat protein